ncbi:hypothetical protein BKI52_42785 [marine bacterium AO1-C]|nr:hypothetical protein BKI52_42785 [marine bacterium AO1-C]
MKIKFYFILLAGILIASIHQTTFAQRFPVVIQGNVLDAETNKPISKVNVFLSGTTIGSSTNAQGKYTIQDSIPTGKYSLVFSHIKYSTDAQGLIITKGDTLKIDILLIPKHNTLNEVTVKADKDFLWRKQFKTFKEEFLGTSKLGKQCKILNPWVLNFKQNQDTLRAFAQKEIIVENKALGYKVYCDLVKFHNVSFFTTYLAYYRFETLSPLNKKQGKKWQKQRLKAFYGSFRHFASALLHNRLKQEGFQIKYSKLPPEEYTPDKPLKRIKSQKLHFDNEIILPDYLSIVYRKREEIEFIRSIIRQGQRVNAMARFNRAIPQNSWMSIKGGRLKVSDLGITLDNPLKLQTYGYWAWQRVGNLLPFDFFPEKLGQAIKLSKISKVKELKRYTQNHPQEKVYLHHDKPFYALGDTIWVSGYVVNAQSHRPSKLSRILYVDLIDNNDHLKQQIKLKVANGKAFGDFILDTAYAKGTYRLRAYTKLMAVGSRDYLFQRKILVGQINKHSFEGNISYQNTSTQDQKSIQYKLALHDQFSQALANQEFEILLKTNQQIYNQQKLKTNAQGVIQGSLNIPNSEKAPYIELIAKTKGKSPQHFYIPTYSSKTQLGFFPEGGQLVAGVANQVAFKATNHQGLGVPVKGQIINSAGKNIIDFKSKHLGMGSFTFTPQAGETYTAILSAENGTEQQIALPQSSSQYFVLNIHPLPQNQSKLILRSPRKRKKFTIIAHCRGKSVYTASGIVKQNRPFVAIIKHNQLPSGILTFTVFDEEFIPQCERLVFSNNYHKTLQIKLGTPIKAALPREKVVLDLALSNLIGAQPNANVSVAVVDESLVKESPQQAHILSHLLLSSDIKGHIERPNFYFKDKKLETREALDLLMMTQGWRRFTWQHVMANHAKAANYPIEQSLSIRGIVTKPSGRPVAQASVTLLSLNQQSLKVTQTKEDGRFTFDNLHLNKGDRLVFKAVTAKGKTKLKVKLDELADTLEIKPLTGASYERINVAEFVQKTMYLQNQAKQAKLTQSLRLDPSVKMLEEVQVKARKITGQEYKQRKVQLYTQPSYRIRLDSGHFKPTDGDVFMNYIQGKIPSLKVYHDNNTGKYILTFRGSELNAILGGNPEIMYLLDGQPVDSEVLRILDLQSIAYIDMVGPSRASMYGAWNSEGSGTAMNGVLAIYTKKDYKHGTKTFRHKGIKGLNYQEGYHKTREFYVPPYNNPKFAKNKLPDYRSTIYWNPSVKVVNGKAQVSFFNAEAITNYRIIVEGISNEGAIGRMTYQYQIKNKE